MCSSTYNNTPHGKLKIRISPSLNSLEFFLIREGRETLLGIIKNPLLLWDPVKIRCLSTKEIIAELFGQNTIIEYDGVSIIWNYKVWPPAIDSLFLAKILRETDYLNRNIRTVVDVGSGTGFLGIYFCVKNKAIKEVYAVDVDPEAARWTAVNAIKNNVADRILVCVGDGLRPFREMPFADLIICNPPYIPTPPGEASNAFNPYGGTYLLENVITSARKYSDGELIIVYSSVSAVEVEKSKKKEKLKGEILGRLKIPFRVPAVLSNRRWLDFLINQRGLKFYLDKKDGYYYWHEIFIERIPLS